MKERQPSLDPAKLVFLDETGASTSMTPLYGRSPRGERCLDRAPQGHWKTTTFVAALRQEEVVAPMVSDGPMDGAMFVAWVREFLAPTLKPGDVVIADNLSSHKVTGVKEAIEAVGASLVYLPPYSPDLNPIEKLFARFKTLLRKAKERTLEALTTRLARLLETVTPQECRNYFASSGYVCG